LGNDLRMIFHAACEKDRRIGQIYGDLCDRFRKARTGPHRCNSAEIDVAELVDGKGAKAGTYGRLGCGPGTGPDNK
jgi:hypothetical protein